MEMKKPGFWVVVWIIVKCSIISFGGGNAIFPVLKAELVEKNNYLEIEEFNKLIVTSNLLPGPSIVEAFSYIAFKFHGFWKGLLITFIATLPHVILFFGIFLGISYLPQKYLYVVSVGVIPTIAGIVCAFTYQFIKKNRKSLLPVTFWLIFLVSFCVTLFLPTPFNAPVFVMIIIIIYAFVVQYITIKKTKKKAYENELENKEENHD